MDSMVALAKASRFNGVGMASVVGLLVAGYLGLAGSAFAAFHRGAAGTIDSLDNREHLGPALVCDCHYDTPSACVTN